MHAGIPLASVDECGRTAADYAALYGHDALAEVRVLQPRAPAVLQVVTRACRAVAAQLLSQFSDRDAANAAAAARRAQRRPATLASGSAVSPPPPRASTVQPPSLLPSLLHPGGRPPSDLAPLEPSAVRLADELRRRAAGAGDSGGPRTVSPIVSSPVVARDRSRRCGGGVLACLPCASRVLCARARSPSPASPRGFEGRAAAARPPRNGAVVRPPAAGWARTSGRSRVGARTAPLPVPRSRRSAEARARDAKFTSEERTEGAKKWMASRGRDVGFDFTHAQKRELRKFFDFIDADGSGQIDLLELEDPLLSTGLARNRDDLRRLMRMVDVDGSGAIGFDEFLEVLRPNQGGGGARRRGLRVSRGAARAPGDSPHARRGRVRGHRRVCCAAGATARAAIGASYVRAEAQAAPPLARRRRSLATARCRCAFPSRHSGARSCSRRSWATP